MAMSPWSGSKVSETVLPADVRQDPAFEKLRPAPTSRRSSHIRIDDVRTRELFLSTALLSVLSAQDQSIPKRPAFEVATIKPVEPNVPHMVGVNVYPGGRIVINGLTLKVLITTAYGLSYWQVSGGESWVATDEYNIEAVPPESLRSIIKNTRHTLFSIGDARLRDMLQALLIDRFQLRFHRDTKPGDVYVLQRSGKPLGLQPCEQPSDAEPGADCRSFGSIGYADARWVLAGTSMPQLAKYAADYVLHAPVVDRTELPGLFDYKQPVPDADPNYTDNSQSFLRIVSKLGLKLERSKGQVEVLVIDHAAKPSAN